MAFFLCWAPFHAQRLMAIYVVHQTPTAVTIYTILTHISGVTYYVSATINPILYSIMSKKFRHAFKDTLAHCCRKNSMDSSSLRYSNYTSNAPRSNHNSFNNNSRKKLLFYKDTILFLCSNNDNWKIFCNYMFIFKDNNNIDFKFYFKVICY